MHGLVNRSLQGFLRDAYPAAVWHEVAADIGIGPDGFEAMLDYPDALTARFLTRAAQQLDRTAAALLEDLGASLAAREPLRRLLRFGGSSYADFLISLEDLPDRVALALPDLRLPAITVTPEIGWRQRIRVGGASSADAGMVPPDLVAPVLAGLLRAMADDYGALVVIDLAPPEPAGTDLTLDLLEDRYAPGRGFRLSG